jgi:hypothetical protein
MGRQTTVETLQQLQEELAEVLGRREDLDRKAQAVSETVVALENLANIEAMQANTRGPVAGKD